ncbi:MAG: DUF1080 domain-containing protein [Bacteroidia bacterium]|nr:DUF1080 domain-containing protein [Bacteroidia bacterium]MBT8274866.1 DUF1080 domain-containing protein [Bacteroidia bacterium]NNJ82486.1 DUF1080 domain-containing protein [Flavobacteriaceae bacterium]NNK55555.1 DUF1080 domain-containing protein [Flavobacteriaceae bacterium]NNM07856.1 DUF1080 domain-containing protein [Flavobacteriaceae bacterium]
MRNILLLFLFCSFLSCSQMKDIAKDDQSNQNWITLFDGSSFGNWRGYLSDEMPSEWTIEDDAMLFTPSDRGGKNIITREKFTNFVLSLEWKVSEGGNSGIFWGVFEDTKFPEPYQTGPEVQVLDNENHPDSFLREGRRKAGAIYDLVAYPGEFVNPAGSWNLCVVEINYNTSLAKVTMNNKESVEFPINGPEWKELVRNSKFKDWPGFGIYHSGHISLQDHGNKVWYRNIRIKKLD